MTNDTSNITEGIADVRQSLHQASCRLCTVASAAIEAKDSRAKELAKIEVEFDALRRRLFDLQ